MRKEFLSLIRLGIGHRDEAIHNNIDWNSIEVFAERQGLLGIVLDGIERLPNTEKPPQDVLLEWIGESLQDYEYRYDQYRKAIAELAGFYNSHGYKMMVLKGYACGLNWPKPEHRPCGDIDIWLFGKQKEADALLESLEFVDESSESVDSSKSSKFKSSKIEIDNSHHHHTVFEWNGFTVENHYDFINVHHHESHAELENKLKELGQDDSNNIELFGEKVYLPSPELHALFLIKHAVLHFCSTELNIRQILDWAFFVEKHGKEVHWDWLLGILEEHGMLPFFQILNAICVEDLGFNKTIFPTRCFDLMLKDKVVDEVFSYVYENDTASNFFKRQVNRYQRWKANEWKHELCYKESMWSAFWSGVWGHLLKPASI